jgi:phage regulator Rha-like protein
MKSLQLVLEDKEQIITSSIEEIENLKLQRMNLINSIKDNNKEIDEANKMIES